MNEQLHQSDDCFIPKLFMLQPPQNTSDECKSPADNFLKNFQGWADILPLDECVA